MTIIFQHPSEQTTDFQPIAVDLLPGRYLLECWGAQGGTGITSSQPLGNYGGLGAYARGILDLRKQTTFHLYIGTKGEDGQYELNTQALGGWNGGGKGGEDISGGVQSSGAGGGATDIRLVRAPQGEEATNDNSLDSRIIVAAGGSGSVAWARGAPGGDLTGYIPNSKGYVKSDTTQDDGNRKGQGEDGKMHSTVPSSGAGGGFFGGKAGLFEKDHYTAVSSSGSSYVSGYPGCETMSNQLGSVFNYVLLHPRIVNGFSSFPSVDYETTKTYETGHEGNGAVKITHLNSCKTCSCSCRHSNIFIYVATVIIIQNDSE